MKKQYAVFGLGSFGSSVAVTLQNLGCEVVVVDNRMERIQEIADDVSYAIQADMQDQEVIRSLGARNLDGVIIAVSEDMEASVMATIISKELGVPYVLAKARNEMHAKILRKLGADAVVFPERETGERIAKNLVSTNFADWIALSPEYSITEVAVPESWSGKSLQELDVRRSHDVSVVGVVTGDKVEVNPDPNRPLGRDMVLILVGANEALENFQKG
ncbi:potassium channel family protein [Extibacter muris]|uniref:potassium channel family protein n=1 Tax=Extibacter muris TaxID=1796622 RepID=UPI000E5369FE|nr:TrkA family potassium uptake protein [Extibacter muris]MCB6201500.1 TrkA family potassium uptake protein [Extibacter muris]MCQ4662826.1 TrkA family potassium uptake protein [Extibacter muris]MCQ4692759.1 TrkA family potassium uptake protein [Extibacter muris]RGU92006.1 TrkA family potassium uptake protein [Clostridium sp. AF15-17LB]